MTKVIKEYSNPNNNGKERVIKDGDKYFVNSFVGGEWLGARAVTKSQIESCMIYTKAPSDVIEAILS